MWMVKVERASFLSDGNCVSSQPRGFVELLNFSNKRRVTVAVAPSSDKWELIERFERVPENNRESQITVIFLALSSAHFSPPITFCRVICAQCDIGFQEIAVDFFLGLRTLISYQKPIKKIKASERFSFSFLRVRMNEYFLTKSTYKVDFYWKSRSKTYESKISFDKRNFDSSNDVNRRLNLHLWKEFLCRSHEYRNEFSLLRSRLKWI